MKQIVIKVFYRYKDWMRDIGVFTNEYSTAGRFVNEALLIITFLAVKGIDITWYQATIIYIIGLTIFGLLGKILIWLKVPHYAQTLSNEMNPELQEIIKRLKAIENKIDDK